MATPRVSEEECRRREDAINECLREGYQPLGQYGGLGSAVEEAVRRLELNGSGSTLNLIRRGAVSPDWSLFKPPPRAERIRPALRREAQHGYAPDYDLTHAVPEGLALKGTSIRYDGDGEVQQYWNKTKQEGRAPEEAVALPDPKRIVKLSTLYDQAGQVTQQWVSEKPEDEQREALWRAFAAGLAEELPRTKPVKPPAHPSEDLAAVLPVGDHHVGMMAWGEETGGANYDLKIAERLLCGATDYLVAATPACGRALIAVLGDFAHIDGMKALTPASGKLLDVDGRYQKMARVVIKSIRYMIHAALAKHGQVHVIIEVGNHDPSLAAFLAECLANIYENEPRISIDTSPSHFHYWEFGACLVGTHHGDGAKMEKLPLIMASDRHEAWGRTKYRYWLTGHIHQQQVREFEGVLVESFRILAPADAWAAGKGYRGGRDMKAIVLHREHGEVARHTVNPEMF